MKNILKSIMFLKGSDSQKESDFSDFFTKSSGEKKKVITQVLREANQEQKKMVDNYRRQPTRI